MENKQIQGQIDSKCSLLVDHAGVLLHANQRFIEMSGYEQQQFIGKGINQLFIDIVWPESQKIQSYKEQLPFSLLLADKRIISVPLSIDMQDRNNYLVQFDINLENQRLEINKNHKSQSVNILSYAKIGLWHLDLASNKPQWSDTVYEIHEVNTDIEVTLETAVNFYHDEYKDKIQQVINDATANKSGWDEELMIKTAKGNLRWVRAVGLPIFDASNQLLGFHGIFQDITEQINRQEAQKMTTKRLELAMHASNVGVWELNLITGGLVWDERMFGLYDVKKKDFSGHYVDWKNTVHPGDLKIADAALKHSIETKTKFDTTFRVIWSTGEIRVMRAFADIIMKNGVPIQMIGVNWDITDIREKELKLEKVARVDDLTQLGNRFSFNEAAEKILHHAKKSNRLCAFLFIDADNFKNINDYYGHHIGDAFLKEFSARLQSACRDRDLAFRQGGDEFAIITVIPHLDI